MVEVIIILSSLYVRVIYVSQSNVHSESFNRQYMTTSHTLPPRQVGVRVCQIFFLNNIQMNFKTTLIHDDLGYVFKAFKRNKH